MNQPDSKQRGPAARVLQRFIRNEDGILTIEAIMVLPLLIWSVWASYSFFDGYRQSARNVKAAYAIADVLSRESGVVTKTYVDTLYGLMQAMVADRSTMSMRVSFFRYDEDNDRHIVQWSCHRGIAYDQWTDSNVGEIKDNLPVMPDEGRMLLVETQNIYQRPFKIGFGSHTTPINNFVFTHPRVFDPIANNDPDCQV